MHAYVNSGFGGRDHRKDGRYPALIIYVDLRLRRSPQQREREREREAGTGSGMHRASAKMCLFQQQASALPPVPAIESF